MSAEPDEAHDGDQLPVTGPYAAQPSPAELPDAELPNPESPDAESLAAEPRVPGTSAEELLALLEGDGELTGDQVAALARLDEIQRYPDNDDPWADDNLLDSDPAAGRLPEWSELSVGEQQVWMDAEEAAAIESASPVAAAEPESASPVVAEVLEAGFTHRQGGQGRGFAAGGALDRMEPGGTLATLADRVWEDGFGRLSDDELCGFLAAQRRLASRAAGAELAAAAELAARRAGPDGRPGEHVEEELAAVLTLTGRAASLLAGRASAMTRLPGVAAALAVGRIDLPKAAVFADETACLDDIAAAAIAASVLPEADGMTTGQLRRALRREILALDPQAAMRRRQEAEKDARVETWAEASGTGAIAGRDLAPAAVIQADKNLNADARWLKQHGATGTYDQLRAEAMIARLTGRSLASLLPSGTAGTPAAPPPAQPGQPAHLGGSVNLIMPASAWLGLSDLPGEVAGHDAVDAGTCRDLAAALAAHSAARWCVTLTGRNGRAVAHGCARAGPGPPGAAGPAAWLAGISMTGIEAGTCSHQRETAGYRPSDSLRHLIKIRSRRCGYPGCGRPASRCDDDHTVPYHRGGRTCECNLHPLCRRHHQAKQAPGWYLSQPEPGVLTWRLPSGRRFTVTPEPYLT
jgi:hypothetical protein